MSPLPAAWHIGSIGVEMIWRSLSLLILSTALLVSPAAAFRNVATGTLVDNPALKAADGMVQPLLLGSDGAPTVVVFWSTWSPRSVEALADLQRLYAASGLQVAAINVDAEGQDARSLARVRQVVTEQGARFPVFIDRGLRLYGQWGVVAVPSFALVDGEGRVSAVLDGYPPGQRQEFLRQAAAATASAAGGGYSAARAATDPGQRVN